VEGPEVEGSERPEVEGLEVEEQVEVEDEVPAEVVEEQWVEAVQLRPVEVEELHPAVGPEQPWLCNDCPKAFETNRQVYDHWRTCHKNPGTCAACGKSFVSQKLLRKHVKYVHGDSIDHSCGQCGLGFTEQVKLTRHQRVCGVPGLRSSRLLSLDECALCERRFSRPGNLRRHVIAAHKVLLRGGGPSFLQRVRARRAKRAAIAIACNICHAAFTLRADLQQHMRKKHEVRSRGAAARAEQEPPEDVQSCDHCPTQCRTGKELRKHMLSEHKGEKVWTCFECDKAFSSPGSLRAHRSRHHSGARLFTCSPGLGHAGCGKAFRLNDSLRKHKKVCGQVTGKPFNQLSGVQRRRRVDARVDRFRQELEGLDGEERHLFLLRLARDPDILDTINPFDIEDVLSVSGHSNRFRSLHSPCSLSGTAACPTVCCSRCCAS
jgi:KRAB domain-containing zinc finger protein